MDRAKKGWLWAVYLLVITIILVGGITRLTRSGLSIVEWRPITGAIPPLSDEDWNLEFAKYRQSPEYRVVNSGMALADFKAIYFWEYIHRLLGRLVGLVTLLPGLVFLALRRLEKPLAWRMLLLFLLGGLQGLIGWLMVASGLVDEPRVSHFRLALHLGLATFIASLTFWFILSFRSLTAPHRKMSDASGAQATLPPGHGHRSGALLAWGAVIAIFVQLLVGAFAAGLRSGHVFNTFPLMGDSFLPLSLLAGDFWNHPGPVQVLHRLVAYLLVPLLFSLSGVAWVRGLRVLALLLAAGLAIQILLGAFVVLYAAPVTLSSVHQAVGLGILQIAVVLLHRLK